MAPKPAAPAKKNVPESGVSIQGYCDAIKGVAVLNELTGKPVKRGEAALQLWSHAIRGEPEREEIFKTGCVPNLVSMLERGDTDDKLAAVGAISVLARSEKHITEVISSKVIVAANNLLASEHARSKLPAAELLAHLAPRAEYSSKVADVALGTLALALMDAGPGWAGAQKVQHHAAQAIKALIENIQGESADIKQMRRMTLLNMGVVPVLVRLIGDAPRMPQPAQYPAPPPALGKKGSEAKASTKAKGKKGGDDTYPQGRKDAIATSAAACLRFLAVCPGFVEQLLAAGSLQSFVDALLTANEVQAAYISGILWEICADAEVARHVFSFGAVPALLHVCSRFLAAAGSKKASSKKKAATENKKEKKEDTAMGPPNFFDMAVCNAAGALHHLTFLDEAKLQVGKVRGMAILAACLRSGNTQTYENATGALWNVGLDVNNTAALQAVSAPGFLAQPVPSTWCTDHVAELSEASEEEAGAEEGEPLVGPFITQNPV